MFCKKCGNKLADGAKFCGVCGTVVQAQADPIPNTTPVDRDNVSYTIPLVREEKAAKAAAVTKGGKNSLPMKKLLLGVAALAVVVLVVVLISSLFGGRTVYLTTESISNSEVGKNTSEYVYDEDGNLVEYSYSAKYKDWYADYLDDYSYSWTYEYEDGRIVAAEYEYNKDSVELEYIYDKKGNLETVESDDFEGEVTCDDKGRIVEMEFDGDLEVSMECSYFDNGVLKEMEYTRGNYRYVYVYNERGQTLEYTSYNKGQKSTVYTYEYDEDGNRLEYDYKYYYNNRLSSSTYETWEYDKKGNLIAYTEKRTSGDDKLTIECEVVGDENVKEWVITKLSGDKEAFSSITDYLKKGDTYMEETYDEHGNCIERITYGETKNKNTWEYQEFKAPKGYLIPYTSDPQFCQFID